MKDKLDAIRARFDELGVALTNPAIVNDNRKFSSTSKEYRSLEKIVNAYSDYRKVLDDAEFYKEALNGDDEEMRELAKEEAPPLEERKQKQDGVSQYMTGNGGTFSLTYTVLNATWTAALRILTATTGFRTRTAASNGSKKRFS